MAPPSGVSAPGQLFIPRGPGGQRGGLGGAVQASGCGGQRTGRPTGQGARSSRAWPGPRAAGSLRGQRPQANCSVCTSLCAHVCTSMHVRTCPHRARGTLG